VKFGKYCGIKKLFCHITKHKNTFKRPTHINPRGRNAPEIIQHNGLIEFFLSYKHERKLSLSDEKRTCTKQAVDVFCRFLVNCPRCCCRNDVRFHWSLFFCSVNRLNNIDFKKKVNLHYYSIKQQSTSNEMVYFSVCKSSLNNAAIVKPKTVPCGCPTLAEVNWAIV
jgi:hypothetical protein